MLLSSVLAPPPSTPPPQSSSPPQNDPPPVEETSQSGSETTGSSEDASQSGANSETSGSESSGSDAQSNSGSSQDVSAQSNALDSNAPAVASSTSVDPTPQASESIALSNAITTPAAESTASSATVESVASVEEGLRDYATAAVESRKLSTDGGYTDQLFGNASLTDLLKSGGSEATAQPRTVLTEAVEVYTTLQSYKGEEARAMSTV